MPATATPATATIHSLPGDGSRAVLNQTRERLARAIAALADEVETYEKSMRPAQRLGQLSADLANLDREIAELQGPYQTELAHWIAGGEVGERPAPSLRIATLEARRRLLASDAEAVERIRGEAEQAHQRAATRVRERQAERDEALAWAAVDAAAAFAAQVWAAQLQQALGSQAILAAMAGLLSQRGADQAADQVRELIKMTRHNTTCPANPTPGRKLLDDLVVDARALLEVTP